ncbi:MAG TPA: Gfo/Idh/MocA family oxidoreductase [Limnochordia bacterium]|nr:Gfo/Idh/MocA family oxidoreductase [Limnochordia bacterium]
MKQLRVGIVGTGMAFERLHLPAYQALTKQYKLTALCDARPGKAKAWAAKLGIPETNVTDDPVALAQRDDIEVIDIMVPIARNFAVTEAVARAVQHTHKGIICEKPLAPTEEQAVAARALPRQFGVPILIAENYRYNEEVQKIRAVLEERRVGEAVYFIQNRVMDTPKEMLEDKFAAKEWRQHPDFPGGIILDTGVHEMAALHTYFGPIAEVHAYGVPQDDDFAPYAALQATLRFQSGLTGQFTFYSAGKEMQRPLVGLRIFCTQGMIYLEERDVGTINLAHNDGRSEQLPYKPQQGYYWELLNFYNHLTQGEPLASPPEIEFGDTRAMLAILRSAKEGRPVAVDRAPVLA